MIIVGAKGFAKEVLEVVLQDHERVDRIVFFDNISNELPQYIFNRNYEILKTIKEAENFLKIVSPEFTLGIGNPEVRKALCQKFIEMGGELKSTISPFAKIGKIENEISEGCNIMTGTIITSGARISKGCLINLNCTIGHDAILEDFVELSPGVNISGNVLLEERVLIGTNATVLPKIKIGQGSVIGAGAVVTKDIPSNVVAFGAPARIIKSK